MKYSALYYLLFVIFVCGCHSTSIEERLLDEQKLLKDSANNMNERISRYMENHIDDSAEVTKKQLAAVHGRLIAIQFSLDSIANGKRN